MTRTNILGFLLATCIGAIISMVPNLCMQLQNHSLVWVADDDELFYLSVATPALIHHPLYIGDPFDAHNQGTSIYPWIQLGPAILLTYLFQSGPLSLSIYWHLFAGASFGGSAFCLFRYFLKDFIAAIFSTIIFICNSSSVAGTIIIKNFYLTYLILRDLHFSYLFYGMPHIFPSYRIVTPALSIFALFVFIWLFARSVKKEAGKEILIACGVVYGSLFYILFYYWTVASLAMFLYFLIDRKAFRKLSIIGVIGLVIGLPSLISGYLIKTGPGIEALHRTMHFVKISHFTDLEPSLLIYSLTVCTGLWVYFLRRDLTCLWLIVFSSLLLRNHQLLTGLQIQNYHYEFIYGEGLSILEILALVDLLLCLRPASQVHWIAALLAIVMFASGIGLRAKEGLSSDNSVLIQASLKSYYAEHFDGTLDKGSVVAGDPDYLKLCFLDDLHPLIQEAAWFSLSVSDRELDRRIALNQYLAGETRESFVKTQTPSDYGMAQWGPQRPDKLESREHAFDQDQIDPLAEIRYFKVKYIVLAAGSHPPPKLLPYVKKIKSGPWDIYSLSL